ncbi:uncharacterized protein [Nicotiana tomentosiformis]|uniref:uncharacterized protein n=1 Tax=Nicotiana tomentosiformis TaxID=4098 RepID=UPI00388C4B7B
MARALEGPMGGLSKTPELRPSEADADVPPFVDPSASILHHESFLQYRFEVNQLELEIKELAQKRDMYKLLSEQHEEVAKNFQAELDAAQKEHTDLVEKVKVFEVRNKGPVAEANNNTSQVQQKIDQIDQLRKEMDEIQVMADGWKNKMDLLASEKETAEAKMSSVEVQLRVAKEKADAWARQNEDLQAQLGSAIAERDALGKELEITMSKLEATLVDTDEMVAQYKADFKAAEARLKTTAEYMRRLSRWETVEEILARGFDLSTEIEEAKRLEVEAKRLDEHLGEEGSEGSEESEYPDSSGDELGSGEYRAEMP